MGARAVAVPAHEVGVRQYEADQQRLLLAGGADAGRHLLGAVADDEVGAVRPFQRAARRAVALARARQRCGVGVLHVDGGRCAESASSDPADGQFGPGEGARGRRLPPVRDGGGQLGDAAARAAAMATPVSAMMRSRPAKRASSRTSSASSRLRCCMARSNWPSRVR